MLVLTPKNPKSRGGLLELWAGTYGLNLSPKEVNFFVRWEKVSVLWEYNFYGNRICRSKVMIKYVIEWCFFFKPGNAG